MLLSRAAVTVLKKNNLIKCNHDDAPDDMTLGMKLKGIGIPLTHSIYLHQVCEIIAICLVVFFVNRYETPISHSSLCVN